MIFRWDNLPRLLRLDSQCDHRTLDQDKSDEEDFHMAVYLCSDIEIGNLFRLLLICSRIPYCTILLPAHMSNRYRIQIHEACKLKINNLNDFFTCFSQYMTHGKLEVLS
jgi:hypothetical protein